jgi:predicted enzyme related to lactoylglutathione lyase
MPEFTNHVPGTFCYAELASTDPAASGEFYMDLFGWSRNDQDLGEFGTYTQFQLDGHTVAAQYRMPAEQRDAGVPANWGQYVSVEDADAAAARAGELGGSLVMGPLDVMEHGRMAVLADPAGAVFCLWQTKANCGATLKDEPGAMCWNELMTRDTAQARDFYGGLFGWEGADMDLGEQGTYTSFSVGGKVPAAGMMALTEEMGPVPPHWMVYFRVADCRESNARAGDLGAETLVAPTGIPGMGVFAVLKDPVGSVFGIYQSLR